MQTFSYLQRSSHDEKNLLKGFILPVALVVYEPLTTIYPYLPLLLGLAFWRIFLSPSIWEKGIWFFYLYLFGVDHRISFLALIGAIVGSYYLLRYLLSYFVCEICLKLLGVLLVYVLFVSSCMGLFWLLQMPWHPEWNIFWIYLLADILIVVLYA